MSSTRPHFASLQNLKFAGFSRRHERNNPASLLLPILQVEIPSSHATKTLFPAPEPEPTSPYLPRAAYWAAAMADDVLSPAIQPNAHGLEHVFRQYRGRRAGIVKALTEDVEEFYEQCDPDKKALCLFGRPDGTWEVNQLPEEVPVQLPEPVCGINFARDVTPKKVWLSIVAVHSDAWLMSIAFYHAGRVAFDRDGRKQLFRLINRLPTVYEAVKGSHERQAQIPNSSRKNSSSSQPPNQVISNCKPVTPALPMLKEENYADFNSWAVMEDWPMLKEEDDGKEGGGGEDQAITKCAGCEEIYSPNDGHLWIGCDHCQRWFHGKCVGVTTEMADRIERYMCPSCSYKATMKPSDL